VRDAREEGLLAAHPVQVAAGSKTS
jgi:hypothetical protein